MNTIRKAFESSGVLTIEGKLNTALAEEADEFIEVCATILMVHYNALRIKIQRLSKHSAGALHIKDYANILPTSLTDLKVKARENFYHYFMKLNYTSLVSREQRLRSNWWTPVSPNMRVTCPTRPLEAVQ